MDLGVNIDVVDISAEAPCGADLFAASDEQYANFTVRAEGLLPASFYSRVDGTPFDRTSVDLVVECKTGEAIAARTHDLRLLSLLVKLYSLDRDALRAVKTVEKMATLVDARWDLVHPRSEDGDYSMRMVSIQVMDDNTHVILPLQYATLFTLPRLGPVSARSLLIASGGLQPREGEQPLDAAAVERGLYDMPIEDLRAAHGIFTRLHDALERIRATWLDRAGFDEAVRFDLLLPFATKMRDLIGSYVAKRDGVPADASSPAADAQAAATGATAVAGAAGTVAGSIGSFGDAGRALLAAAEYFARCEPSNPALPLIRQAHQLMGKSFIDVLRIIAPSHVEAASLQIGRGPFLPFPVDRLSEFSTLPDLAATEGEAAEIVVGSRQDAVALLGRVNAFYAQHEPSSPVPLFCERAIALAGRDFLGLVRDILPEEALKDFEKKVN
jgi:type VI secretion system protein ImpA